MFPDTDITFSDADIPFTAGRFLGFNSGDWFMMLGGFMVAALLVWLA